MRDLDSQRSARNMGGARTNQLQQLFIQHEPLVRRRACRRRTAQISVAGLKSHC
jgi:hypothetical protein